jgi:hypothetical protein
VKTWTVVVELTEDAQFTKQEVEKLFTNLLNNAPLHGYTIYEITEAGYGPLPGQVHLAEPKRFSHQWLNGNCTKCGKSLSDDKKGEFCKFI